MPKPVPAAEPVDARLALDDLAAHVLDGAAALEAFHALLAVSRDGAVVPACSARVLLAPALDAMTQAAQLVRSLQARDAAND